MAASFYFYDLETSGFDARRSRIMQFAGQRTDMDLKPLGEPDNLLVKITPDVLPDPDAVLVHGITPQKTLAEGVTEAELVKYLTSQVFTPDTIAVGYNNIRFDDDFIRFTFWRNFTDAYEWCWKDGRSRWDLLDVVRMTRALRPEGIEWPYGPDGKPSNRLELLSAVNKLDHANAHDALSDVVASMAVARMIRDKQPKLFDYLLMMRDKRKVAALITNAEPVVYSSGRYPSEFDKTTVAVMVAQKNDKSGAIVYDLRTDPDEFTKLGAAELAKRWGARGEAVPYFPAKTVSYNKSPAIAPLEVLEKDDGYQRLKLDKTTVQENLKKLRAAPDFGEKLLKALDIMWPKAQARIVSDVLDVDGALYDGFVSDADRTKMSVVRAAQPEELSKLDLNFGDERLKLLLPLYQARNYPKLLDKDERQKWEDFCRRRLTDGGDASRQARFFARLADLANQKGLTADQKYLLEELQLYAQSYAPGL